MSSNNHSTRQVLPLSAAVKGPRFSTSKHWEISQTAREVLDSFDLPLRREPTVDHSESIVMHGSEIVNTLRTGAHVVKQTRTSDHLPTLPVELAIVPFETVADASVQDAAATALAALNNRKPHARRTVRVERAATDAPWTAHTWWLGVLLVGSVLASVAWLYAAFHQ
jgi:hypothetical protein